MRHRAGLVILGVFVVAVGIGAAAQPPQGRGAAPTQGRGGGSGPADPPIVDAAAAERGKALWAAECITCHGATARGTDAGPNLVRSVVVLRDRYGSQLTPFLKKGHKTQSGAPSAGFTDVQVQELAHFLRQRINDTLRGSPIFQPGNVLTGDPKAGEAFFTGAGKCSSCHSATGDLAGIGGRLRPVDLQQRFLFPRATGRGRGALSASRRSQVTVTVTPPSGPAISGVLVQMDDFNVALRDDTGAYRSFARTPQMKVVKTDPLAAHIELLDRLTDKDMHDVVAYLETLK